MSDVQVPGALKVLKPGILTLITDLGRYGQHRIGLTTGGPIDPMAFRWANRLLGNESNASMLEASFGGLSLEAEMDTTIAVTGATAPLSINGVDVELWRSHRVKAGDTITLQWRRRTSKRFEEFLFTSIAKQLSTGFDLDA